MTVEWVKEQVEEIRKISRDDEAAHAKQDRLYLAVLTEIAKGGCASPEALAAEAIKVDEIEFARWCA